MSTADPNLIVGVGGDFMSETTHFSFANRRSASPRRWSSSQRLETIPFSLPFGILFVSTGAHCQRCRRHLAKAGGHLPNTPALKGVARPLEPAPMRRPKDLSCHNGPVRRRTGWPIGFAFSGPVGSATAAALPSVAKGVSYRSTAYLAATRNWPLLKGR